ncbi:MAG: CarD family transcriptional regulator [Coriobacteriia bacterium]|nr:CarD family transcriptional regulator [Coriobacteriia bacterium]
MSYQVEDYVLKGADVYRIVAVEQRSLGSMPPEDYFVLDVAYPSKHKQGMSYIPVSKADMSIRPVPSENDIHALFDANDPEELEWVENRNKRINEARGIISSGDLRQIVRLVRIYRKRVEDVPEKDLSTKDREMEGRCFDLLAHVMAASCDISAERSSQLVDGLL